MTAAELRRIRLRLDLTQREMAAKIGVSRRSLVRWETGRAPVPLVVALAVRYLDGRG